MFAAERANGKKLPVRKKEVFRVAPEQLLGQRKAEVAKQALAEQRQAAELTWSNLRLFVVSW